MEKVDGLTIARSESPCLHNLAPFKWGIPHFGAIGHDDQSW